MPAVDEAINFAEHFKANMDQKLDEVSNRIADVSKRLPPEGQAARIALERPTITYKPVAAFFAAVRNRTEAVSFNRYYEFVNRLLCRRGRRDNTGVIGYGAPSLAAELSDLRRRDNIYGVDAYNLLKQATEAFLILEAGLAINPARDPNTGSIDPGRDPDTGSILTPASVVPEEREPFDREITFERIRTALGQYLSNGSLPYLSRVVDNLLGQDGRRQERLPFCEAILQHRFNSPSLIELIWSYFHEEGMLAQTLNAISLRFQNKLGPDGKNPLAHLEIDPLRPLNNLLWGYIQEEHNRLTVPRRAYEYDHHYGLRLYGKAVPQIRSADSRSKFLEAFHVLLNRAMLYYREAADNTVTPDTFPLLNGLREVHLILAEGAHNQFGDLPWTARVEMLIQQWLLARPEMREFLHGRAMVPYREPWMERVDTMKKIQGWTDASITHFNDLARTGEQILLTIRYHNWNDIDDEDEARLWVEYWRPEVQRYVHAYRAITGVDLESKVVYTQPWIHLRNRQAEQRRHVKRPQAI